VVKMRTNCGASKKCPPALEFFFSRPLGSPVCWHGYCKLLSMGKTIYMNTANPVIERELISLMGDFQIRTFSLPRDSEGIFVCASPSLWLVEINPSYLKGLFFVKRLIEEKDEPVVVLSRDNPGLVRDECYAMGVDDFVEEPWYPRVIVLRIAAALKRRGLEEEDTLPVKWTCGESSFRLDRKNRRLLVDGEDILLTPSQWNLFNTLMANANRVVSREILLEECLEQGNRKTRTLDNHMKNLRKKIGPEVIDTVRGYGYRLRGEAC